MAQVNLNSDAVEKAQSMKLGKNVQQAIAAGTIDPITSFTG
jgi:hypothetical protein